MFAHHTVSPNKGSRLKSKVIGRGDGSGRGSYSGKGFKGQTARSGGNIKSGFEGGQTPLIRRMPKFRGFTSPNKVTYQVLNVASLNVFNDGDTIDIVQLFERKIINRKNLPVKVLGDGELEKKVNLKVDNCSESARKKIEDKGGTVTVTRKKKAAAVHAE